MTIAAETSFVLRYFNVIGRAEGCRMLLTAANANWTEENPEWPAAKEKQPFGRLPVLIEKSGNGDEWIICETGTIERYLARTFGFLPADLKRAAEQEQMSDQHADLTEAFLNMARATRDKEELVEEFDALLGRMIGEHQKILSRNTCKNHLFDDSLTYGDIAFYTFYKLFIVYMPVYQNDIAGIVKAKMSPEIVALLASIEQEPLLAPHMSKCESLAALLTA
ncbi:hypothetical protein LPJ70_004395 [Coemansia sp. RSA 2708]|nr:hypothetical protein LPJ70_004395 [Coemansia sp. RSA 2708]